MRNRVIAAAVLVLSIGVSSCDEPLSNITGPTPMLEVKFSSIQQEIFENSDSSGRAACTQCHNTNGQLLAARLNLEHSVAYEQLVNVAARNKPSAIRVIPGDPNSSYLIHKLEGGPDIVGLRMPRNGPPFLTDGQVSVIKRWIELGAAND
jgi:hypothetical protein